MPKLVIRAAGYYSKNYSSNPNIGWRVGEGDSFNNLPRGTKLDAFERIVNRRERKARVLSYRPLEVSLDVTKKEYVVLKGLARRGGFKKKWMEVKDLEYEDFLSRLHSYFSAKLLSEPSQGARR